MPLPHDPDPKLAEYAHPQKLVTTAWLAEHLDAPNLAIVEPNEDVLLYETGHIPGAVKVNWHTELNGPISRDCVDAERFAELVPEKGIGRDATVVFYGDKSSWWAAYELWLFSLCRHPDLRLLDSGRAKCEAEGRPMMAKALTWSPCRSASRRSALPLKLTPTTTSRSTSTRRRSPPRRAGSRGSSTPACMGSAQAWRSRRC